MWIVLIIIAAVITVVLYLLSMKPAEPKPGAFACLEQKLYAHRGLYDNDTDAPENSIPAFRKAVEAGFGIELDVQRTRDGKLVVFHDASLKRMCGVDKILTDLTYDELQQYTLLNSGCRIPLFREVFDIFRDRVPAMIEIKPHGDYRRTAETLMKDYLDGYGGVYCVESFHPLLVRWFRKNRPDVLRGQLSSVFGRSAGSPFAARFMVTNLLTNFYTKPDFISYDFRYRDQFSYRLLRRLYKVENVTWVIQSKEDLRKAENTFDIFIFDSFDPRKL